MSPGAPSRDKNQGIPGFFRPMRLGTSLVVDGGIVSNFPTWVFQDYQKVCSLPILGLRLESSDQPHPTNLKGMLPLLGRVVDTSIRVNTELQMAKIQNLYTISLPTLGVGVTDFDISKYQKQQLYQIGRDKVQAYFVSSLRAKLKKLHSDVLA